MADQVPLTRAASAVDPVIDAARDDRSHEIAPDLAHRRLGIVNVVFYGRPDAGDGGWVLIDTGLPGTRGSSRRRRPSGSEREPGRPRSS